MHIKNQAVLDRFIPLALVVTLILGVVFILLQQDMRVNRGNNPQVQLAQDIARALESGVDPRAVIPSGSPIDMAKSLAPYAIAYDDTGLAITGSGALNGKLPVPPKGVFEYTKTHHEDRITWQPQPGVRSAIVVVRYEGPNPGFILVGRSLAEVEDGVRRLEKKVFLGWFLSLLILFAALHGLEHWKHKRGF